MQTVTASLSWTACLTNRSRFQPDRVTNMVVLALLFDGTFAHLIGERLPLQQSASPANLQLNQLQLLEWLKLIKRAQTTLSDQSAQAVQTALTIVFQVRNS